MTIAIFGLVGVVIGGLLNSGLTVLLEEHRTKRAAKADGRLLLSLLLDAELSFDQTGKTATRCFDADLWERIKAVNHTKLAVVLKDNDWLDLARGEHIIEQACRMAGELRATDASLFPPWADAVHDAVHAVQRLALPSKEPLAPFRMPEP